MQEGAQTPPISDAQRAELKLADEREKKFAFARKLAGVNGGVLVAFAAIALLSGFVDAWSFAIALVVGALAYVELHGKQLLTRYEPRGLVLLTYNQLALIALVTVYALLRIRSGLHEPNPLADITAQSADLADALGASDDDLDGMDELYHSALTLFYGTVIALTAVFQGGCALYYWTRRKHLDAFLAQTPAWVIAWKLEHKS